ncbi:hypothetical protein [Rhizobium sp. CSW-27]|nr:hypothetical protein [Rhizobium sp. CSW-27]
MKRNSWIIIAALVLLLLVVVFGSRPFQETTENEPGQPSPHAITQ